MLNNKKKLITRGTSLVRSRYEYQHWRRQYDRAKIGDFCGLLDSKSVFEILRQDCFKKTVCYNWSRDAFQSCLLQRVENGLNIPHFLWGFVAMPVIGHFYTAPPPPPPWSQIPTEFAFHLCVLEFLISFQTFSISFCERRLPNTRFWWQQLGLQNLLFFFILLSRSINH